jgi:hypothetical protein
MIYESSAYQIVSFESVKLTDTFGLMRAGPLPDPGVSTD